MFCAYLTHPGYGWGELCERTFGNVPSQIRFDWNIPRHTTDDAVPPARRSFTQAELQQLFDYIDDVVDREYAAGSKRWLPALRDSIAFKTCYATTYPSTSPPGSELLSLQHQAAPVTHGSCI